VCLELNFLIIALLRLVLVCLKPCWLVITFHFERTFLEGLIFLFLLWSSLPLEYFYWPLAFLPSVGKRCSPIAIPLPLCFREIKTRKARSKTVPKMYLSFADTRKKAPL
jgi:hypothetical protein